MANTASPAGETLLGLGEGLVNSVRALADLDEDQSVQNAVLSHKELKQLQGKLATATKSLRYIDNASKLINRLPNSVLAKVFLVLKDLLLKPGSPFSSPSSHWVVASHVCMHWRRVALATPSLWTNLLLNVKGGPAQIQAFLDRSKNEPLTIIFGQQFELTQSIARIQSNRRSLRYIIKDSAHRVERVIVEPRSPIDDILRADLLSQRLSSDLSSSLHHLRLPAHPESLSALFPDAFIQVKHLELYSSVIPHFLQVSKPFQHLSVLQLLQAKEPPSLRSPEDGIFKLSRMLRTLSASRHTLRRLTLVGIPFWDDLASAAHDDFPVSLQALQSIELGDWPPNVGLSSFLNQLRFPASVPICIWGQGLSNPTSTSLRTFFQFALTPPDQLDAGGLPRLPLTRFVLSSVPGGDMVAYNNGTLHINGAIPFETYGPLLEPFGASLETAQDLVLTPLSSPLSAENWKTLFALLPLIQNINVRDAEASQLVRALQPSASDNFLSLPHLKTIDIRYSHGSSTADPLDAEYPTEPYTLVVALTFAARERAWAGHKIGRIHLRLDSRTTDPDSWEDMEMAFANLRHWSTSLTYSKGPNLHSAISAKVRAERAKEQEDRWYFVMKEFGGIWPTKAAYFSRLLDSSE